jgi:pimeloyl-ACP methyl ester carboxylesterase
MVLSTVKSKLDSRDIPIVLLRGLSREQAHWGDFVSQLQRALPNPVLTLDLPGVGEARHEVVPVQMKAMVKQLRERLAQTQSGPYHLFAMSLGAMVAMTWAADFPEDIASLILINSSCAQLSPFYWRLKWQNYPCILQALFANVQKREQLILQLTANNIRQRQEQLQHWQQIALSRPVRKVDVLKQLWAASRFKLPAKPQCPTLLLASHADRLVDWRSSQRIAELWQVPLQLHHSAGHDLALDAPKWLLEQAQQFYLKSQ